MHETHAPEDIKWLRELLSALVVIPSVNPPGDESAVASLLEGRLQAAGFETRIAGAQPHRPNLVARRRGSDGGPTLLFNGHMDVQPPGTRWTREPFAAEVDGTTLYFFTSSGMADESVDLVDVARAGRVYARLISDLLG
jgi:acetylornithine deacetylase/succinyl-diaminopimelate desuccinylase-like protein